MVKFTYEKLDQTKNGIRLLLLLPGSQSAHVECRLEHRHFDNNLQYDALSYTWGANVFSRDILLNCESFPMTENLWTALVGLRDQEQT